MSTEIAGLVNSAMVWASLEDQANVGNIPAMVEDYLNQLESTIDADEQLLINLALHALGYELIQNHSNIELVNSINIASQFSPDILEAINYDIPMLERALSNGFNECILSEFMRLDGFNNLSLSGLLRLNWKNHKEAYYIIQNNKTFLEECDELDDEQLKIVKRFLRYDVESAIQHSPLDIVESYIGSYDDTCDYVEESFDNEGITIPHWLRIDYDATFTELTLDYTVIQTNYKFHIYTI